MILYRRLNALNPLGNVWANVEKPASLHVHMADNVFGKGILFRWKVKNFLDSLNSDTLYASKSL